MASPVIGITADFREDPKRARGFSVLFSGYYDKIARTEAVPIILPPTANEETIDRMLKLVDAVVLTGGQDLDPRKDGWMMHPQCDLQSRRRENFDRLLVKRIVHHETPVLGIGSGMQLLNVAMGGNLCLHIPEEYPEAMPHRDLEDDHHRHSLKVVKNTFMSRVYEDGDICVAGNHHMCVHKLAPVLRAAAKSADGLIEALFHVDQRWPCWGVQFHPEHPAATAIDYGVFAHFVRAVQGVKR
jgi:putative glutamine amidotransferase